ncbi:unnamed protein product [Urochloa humidicola]
MVLQTGLDPEQDAVQPAVIEDEDEDDIQPGFTEEDDDMYNDTDDYEQRLKAEELAGFIEKLGPVEHEERLSLIKASFGIPHEPRHRDFYYLPECTRDQRHVGDRVWHGYYHMSRISETDLPAKRYTQCNDPSAGEQCFHAATPILQIFNVKVQTCLVDVTGPVEVYGIVAVRDGEDYCRNYLFNRSRDNPLDISLTGGYLRLLSLRRGMSMRFNCLLEVDIRVKAMGDDDTEDKTLADGCTQFIEDQVCFKTFSRCSMSSQYGSVTFDYHVFRDGVEATIELDFLEVPEGGFSMQMCGYTTIMKNYYAFIDKNCECDSLVRSTGRFPRYFVAIMQMDDYFLVDFAEGKSPLIFKPTIHGNEEKEFSFYNGALVSVKVSWSTTFYC